MRALLNAHPRIAIYPFETHWLDHWHRRFRRLDFSNSRDREYVIRGFCSAMQREGFDLSDPMELISLMKESGEVSFRGTLTTLCVEYARKFGKPRWGEKSPHHCFFLDKLFSWYPNAQVIFMWRDPRDLIASSRKTPWGAHVPPDMTARSWNRAMAILESRKSDARVLPVQYEALTRDPEREMRKVCEFLAEDFIPDMLNRRTSTPVGKNASEWLAEHHAKSAAPITTDSIGKWKADMKLEDARVVEYLCRNAMRRYGYTRETKPLSTGEILSLRFAQMRGWMKRVPKRARIRLGLYKEIMLRRREFASP